MLDPGTEEKELKVSKEQTKQTTDNQKHQKNVGSWKKSKLKVKVCRHSWNDLLNHF